MFASGEPLLLFDLGLTQYIPLIAFPFAALISGAIGRFPRSHYAQMRPLAAHKIAAAQCLAQLRALLGAVLVVLLLFFTYMLLGSIERGILATAWQNGYADVIDLIVYCMRPLTLSLLAAWVMLWMTTGLMALITGSAILCLAIAIIQMLLTENYLYDYLSDAFYVTISLLLVLAIYAMVVSVRRKFVPMGRLLLQLFFCLMITAFLFFGSSEMKGIEGALLAFTCGVVCVLPLTALTWTIDYQRHGVRR